MVEMKYLTISFFGHRYLSNIDEIKTRLNSQLEHWYLMGARKFKIGMHGQFDELVLDTCLAFKKINMDIEICITITSFSLLKKDEYSNSLLEYYQVRGVETVMYEIENIHYKQQIIYSNYRMIEESDIIICYVDLSKSSSGAKRAIDYARKLNKTIINLYKDTDNPFYDKSKEYIKDRIKEYISK